MALNVYVTPSVKNEVHAKLKEKSDEHAIKVFTENVRKVLLGSPYGSKCVLGVDPGLRTGCKVALVDKSGSYVSHGDPPAPSRMDDMATRASWGPRHS